YEAFPWGHTALKVGTRAFVFLTHENDQLGISLKLPASHEAALQNAFVEPTGYGLGKSGWVTARFGPGDDVPLDTLREWIVESYRAVAPKRLVAALYRGM